MKNIKNFKQSMKDLLKAIEKFHNNDCEDVPKNRIIRFRNQNLMKLLKNEIDDIGE